jgi:hypothetical protein
MGHQPAPDGMFTNSLGKEMREGRQNTLLIQGRSQEA